MTFCETMDARPILLPLSVESKLSMGCTMGPILTKNRRHMHTIMCVDDGEQTVAAATKCMSSVAPTKDWFQSRKDGSPTRDVFCEMNSSCVFRAALREGEAHSVAPSREDAEHVPESLPPAWTRLPARDNLLSHLARSVTAHSHAAAAAARTCPCSPRSMNCMVSTTKNVNPDAHSTNSPEMLTPCM